MRGDAERHAPLLRNIFTRVRSTRRTAAFEVHVAMTWDWFEMRALDGDAAPRWPMARVISIRWLWASSHSCQNLIDSPTELLHSRSRNRCLRGSISGTL